MNKEKHIEKINNEIELLKNQIPTGTSDRDMLISAGIKFAIGCYENSIKIIQSEQEEICTYTRDDETNAWECSKCGLTWVFMEDYTAPEDNDMYFCPKCGRKIKVGE